MLASSSLITAPSKVQVYSYPEPEPPLVAEASRKASSHCQKSEATRSALIPVARSHPLGTRLWGIR